MTDKLEIGNNIRKLREQKGLNKREFAETIGLFTADYLGKMERGDVQEPKYSYLIGIGQFCKVSVDFILTGIEIPTKQNVSMYTEHGKEAAKQLNKCFWSIAKLDSEVHLNHIEKLKAQEKESQVLVLQNPDFNLCSDYYQSQAIG